MQVRIKEDLTKTKKDWGVTSEMRDMCGKVYTVRSESAETYCVKGWTFCKEDCEIIKDNLPKYTADSVTMVDDNYVKHTITFDFVKDLSTKEIATAMCLLSTLGYGKSNIQKMVKDDDTLKIGDKVFINFTCDVGQQSSNGVRLVESMLQYNHKVITIKEIIDNKFFQLEDCKYWSFAEEWLTKVVE